ELEGGAIVDRRQVALQLAPALQLQLLRRLVAGIEPAGRLQLRHGGVVGGEAIGLAHLLLPLQAQPAQVFLDAGGELGHTAVAIGVVEAEDEGAALLAREQPVGERNVDVADMQPTRRARRKADADGHATASSRGMRARRNGSASTKIWRLRKASGLSAARIAFRLLSPPAKKARSRKRCG